jgi:hypothetical protein
MRNRIESLSFALLKLRLFVWRYSDSDPMRQKQTCDITPYW